MSITSVTSLTCHTCRANPARFLASRPNMTPWVVCSRCRMQGEKLNSRAVYSDLPATIIAGEDQSAAMPPPLPVAQPTLLDPSTPTIGASRASDPPTSKKAGEAHVVTKGSHRYAVLEAFARFQDVDPPGLTAEQAADEAGLDPRSSPWKRVSELRQWGWLEPTGELRTTLSGAEATVLALSFDGVKNWTEAQQ